jgi:hypothetical protein
MRVGAADELELATFSADVSPPLGARGVCIGFVKEFTEIEHPLLAKGVVLRDAGRTFVLCAIDLEGLCNDSYDMFRQRIARAAGTSLQRVALQSLHQHTAPVYDANAARFLYRKQPEILQSHLDAAEATANRIAKAVQSAMKRWQTVTHVSTGMAKVERVASNRRVPQPDGGLLTRYSRAADDPVLREAPEGIIDQFLRTISFYNGDEPLVRLHYYATHPQSRSGSRVTYDVVGIAREKLERESGVFQIYFTGCGGNIAMGKYNDGSKRVRAGLAERMHAGLASAAKACDQNPRHAISPIQWRTANVQFPLRTDAEFQLAAARRLFENKQANFSQRLKAAMLAAWIERVQAERPVEFSGWSIGRVHVVHLPGEPFVQFQLAAQKAHPDRFVAIAGYGECAMWYIGEDRIYTDRGGYEQTWAFTGPCEQLMNNTISALLGIQ